MATLHFGGKLIAVTADYDAAKRGILKYKLWNYRFSFGVQHFRNMADESSYLENFVA